MRFQAGLAALLALIPAAATAAPSSADRAAAAKGAAWLAERGTAMPGGQQADLIVALRATGAPRATLRGRVRALAREGRAYGTTAGRAAKIARAALAVGANPARFGRVNYVGRMSRDYSRGRYGTNAYDQALAIVALREAGRPVPPAAIRAVARARGAGGWNLSLSRAGPDDVDATAALIEALRVAGVGRGNRALRGATRWLRTQRRPGGGFPSRRGRDSDANSTAAALRALRAMGAPGQARTAAALRDFQRPDGSFRWRAGVGGSPLLATLDAVPALIARSPGARR